ncbi:prolipoprotein diacylglyceryl transferase [Buchnera aphidicola str. APS (Acyrthosiphon pisum)]|uniref:Phosphatidylglycerol--prolipoprotein diacylglyceryl transferase n=1 Tax=Buchnera aphidicola subsp. Acyrthosiphon pisum (strain APS) TaxID=107806 RepID=LGT_BUCAI|nr:prolipoprotein diacylglyceryl transferase [Buchnera aphidicola]P57514.1 RecName: Full=Phosphatidylglycerol--prolipoprotein diacylglyceryl transferase [Buchnera aphidicola str. APS (Acyrthosiphon pisum)]pir/A84981/ prolipoprotein diacylglyceryl transferase [imported] - Buchnera sp. (strain APS) [Buchnera sp. (in: enterobacteria)]BAB13137.1 prolipoprotein diacylglyceryl transferase [Buchnera aphidicola str. APS (Acyrthosiphon pisum)]
MYIFFPKLNPIIFTIGPVSARWYGFMYVISFLFAMWYGKKCSIKNKKIWYEKKIETLLYSIFLGSCIGGRIGYIIFYNFSYYSQNMLSVFYIWEGGMSFHGGLIGAIIVMSYFSFKYKKKILEISDFITPLIPFGLGAGRIGNFINSELWGRVSPNFSYAMIFPNSQNQDLKEIKKYPELQLLLDQYGALPRHPTQLYEFFLEGILLFFIIYFFSKKDRPTGSISGLFLIFYGLFRIFIEFFREPDPQIGLLKNIITMGQILSLPMIIAGLIIMYKSYYKK